MKKAKKEKTTEEKLKEIKDNSGMSPEQWMNTADRWLREHGIITEVTHNNITINLYMNFPKAKYVEYFMDMQNKMMEIHLHFGFWKYLFTSDAKLTEECRDLIKQYLPDYSVTAEKKIYAKKAN